MAKNRIWLDKGVVRGVLYETGFTPLELMIGEEVIGAPVPRPALENDGTLLFECELPAAQLSSGLRIVVLRRAGEAEMLASLPIFIGTTLTEALPGEVAMLRAELDLIKSVLRHRLRDRL